MYICMMYNRYIHVLLFFRLFEKTACACMCSMVDPGWRFREEGCAICSATLCHFLLKPQLKNWHVRLLKMNLNGNKQLLAAVTAMLLQLNGAAHADMPTSYL